MEIALADVASQATDETGLDETAQAFAPGAESEGDADLVATELQGDGDVAADAATGSAEQASATIAEGAAEPADSEVQSAESAIASARVAQAAGQLPVPTSAPRPGQAAPTASASSAITTAETRPIQAASVTPQIEKRGFLSSLFSTQPPRPTAALEKAERPRRASVEPKANPATRKAVRTASLSSDLPPGATGSLTALPGVRAESLFEITRKSGSYDDSDVDINEEDVPVRVASVTGLARLAPNGLAVQTENVDVACLKPQLVRVLKAVEQRYGKKVVVTSGYRSPKRNRRARGAKNSLHMYCAAADIQVAGVSKWDLAKYLRSMPGRGGVGTYCHTKSVHVDIGPERDWNWRCRRSSRKRK